MADPITTLGLCAGVGWLDEAVGVGLRYLGFGHRTVGYVERDAYAAAVLLARMEESSLEPAPVWGGNLESFRGRLLRGKVGGVVAGFPCQPWSNAGKQLGTDDDRWLWPAIVRIVADVEPGFVFLENVSALIAGGGLEYVLSDLAKMGFDAEWCCLTAEAVGAAHRRERVFILAHDPSKGGQLFFGGNGRTSGTGTGEVRAGGIRRQQRPSVDEQSELRNSELADSKRPLARSGTGQERTTGKRRNRPAIDGASVAVAGSDGRGIGQPRGRSRGRSVAGGAGGELGDTASHDERRDSVAAMHGEGEPPRGSSGGVGDSDQSGLQGRGFGGRGCADERAAGTAGDSLFAPGPGADWGSVPEYLWPATERGFRLLVDGSPVVLDESRADQLRCGGNGVVALCGAVAFVELVRRAGLA